MSTASKKCITLHGIRLKEHPDQLNEHPKPVCEFISLSCDVQQTNQASMADDSLCFDMMPDFLSFALFLFHYWLGMTMMNSFINDRILDLANIFSKKWELKTFKSRTQTVACLLYNPLIIFNDFLKPNQILSTSEMAWNGWVLLANFK